MWCGKCQSDVVTELAADNRRVVCATCSTALGEAAVPQSEPANQRNSRAQEARELLTRWANGRASDPFGPPRKRVFDDVLQAPVAPAMASTAAMAPINAPVVRDGSAGFPAVEPHRDSVSASVPRDEFTSAPLAVVSPSAAAARPNEALLGADLDRLTNEILARVERISRDHESRSTSGSASNVAFPTEASTTPAAIEPSPEAASSGASSSEVITSRPIQRIDASLPVPPAIAPLPASPSRTTVMSQLSPQEMRASDWLVAVRKKLGLMSHIAQGLCYVGILGITLGLSLVVLGTFGVSAHLAPTGWLVATLGQMLLLLGVVTTVSVGMDQSAAEMRGIVDERLEAIAAQLKQITQAQHRVDNAHSSPISAPHFSVPKEAPVSANETWHAETRPAND